MADEFKRGDKIKVTQIVRGESGKKKLLKNCRVMQIYPRFMTVDTGKYKTSIDYFDIETGEIQVEKI